MPRNVGGSPGRLLITGGSGFIGTNLVEAATRTGREVLSTSIRPPVCPDHASVFRKADILNPSELSDVFEDFRPTEVVHLAARTEIVEYGGPEAYCTNTRGTQNVVDAVAVCESVNRAVFASSMIVEWPTRAAAPEATSSPTAAYSRSKVTMEELLRNNSSMACDWCIVRPISIWDPWLGESLRQFFLAIAHKRYWHPGPPDPPKRLGYVGNTVFQILRLLEAPRERVHRQAFYMADYETTTFRQWAGLIPERLGVLGSRTLPEPLVRGVVWAGDRLKALGYRHPSLTSFRLANMRTDTTFFSLDGIRAIADPLPYSLAAGVDETVRWPRRWDFVPGGVVLGAGDARAS